MGEIPKHILEARKNAATREVERLIAEWKRGNRVLPVGTSNIYKGGTVYTHLEKHGFLFRDMEPCPELDQFFPVGVNKKGILIVAAKSTLPSCADAKIMRGLMTLARLQCTVNANGPYWNGFLK